MSSTEEEEETKSNEKSESQSFPIHSICESDEDDYETVRKLLKTHPVDERNEKNETALQICSRRGHLQIAKELMQHKADVNSRNGDKETPLIIASVNNQVGIIKLLINHGALVNYQTLENNTALHYAASSGNKESCIELLRNGINTFLRNNSGETAEDVAIMEAKIVFLDFRDGIKKIWEKKEKEINSIEKQFSELAGVNVYQVFGENNETVRKTLSLIGSDVGLLGVFARFLRYKTLKEWQKVNEEYESIMEVENLSKYEKMDYFLEKLHRELGEEFKDMPYYFTNFNDLEFPVEVLKQVWGFRAINKVLFVVELLERFGFCTYNKKNRTVRVEKQIRNYLYIKIEKVVEKYGLKERLFPLEVSDSGKESKLKKLMEKQENLINFGEKLRRMDYAQRDPNRKFSNKKSVKHAFVVGCSKFKILSSLKYSTNDALKMRDVLKGLGFTVTLVMDPTLESFYKSFEKFLNERRKVCAQDDNDGSLFFFYYSGHITQFENENYLIPTDFMNYSGRLGLATKAIPITRVLIELEESSFRENSINIVVLDGYKECYLGSVDKSRTMYTEIENGLCKINYRPEIAQFLISLPTLPNEVVMPYKNGKISLFTEKLASTLSRENTPLVSVFRMVRSALADTQRGYEINFLVDKVYLKDERVRSRKKSRQTKMADSKLEGVASPKKMSPKKTSPKKTSSSPKKKTSPKKKVSPKKGTKTQAATKKNQSTKKKKKTKKSTKKVSKGKSSSKK